MDLSQDDVNVSQRSNGSTNNKNDHFSNKKDINIDPGNLMAIDFDDDLISAKEEDIYQLTKENGQTLIDSLFRLSRSTIDGNVFINLPEPEYRLPRGKPIPEPRPLTKWQKFAQEKGIKKKKKPKLIWDDQLQKWMPRFGYKKNKVDKEKEWIREIGPNDDPNDNTLDKDKTERKAKNEYRRLLNIKRAHLVTDEHQSAKTLATTLTIAKASTASLGKFQDKLPKEKEAQGISAIVPGHKRKRKPEPKSAAEEKQNHLSVVDNILNKRPKMMATEQQPEVDDSANTEETYNVKKRKMRRSANGRKAPASASAKKPKGNKGERNVRKRSVGRKRR